MPTARRSTWGRKRRTSPRPCAVDGHHLEHWADGAETSLANTILLCSRHHTLVHEGGFRVVVDGDRLRFLDPTGAELPNASQSAPIGSLPSIAYTPVPGWDGDPVDYYAAVACLVNTGARGA